MSKLQLILVSVAFLILLVAVAFVYSPTPKTDLDFARMVFKGLIAGDVSVADDIDWSSVELMGYNVAAQYSTYSEAEARKAYAEALIRNLSNSFAQTGGKIADFTNWREHKVKDNSVILAADYEKKDATMLLRVVRVDGERKLNGLRWQESPTDETQQ
jgi:hypothetical protein